MIFNSHPNIQDVLETAYSNGNCLFAADLLYTPLANQVKRIDLKNNHASVLPFQNPHHNALIAISPNSIILIAVDYTGHATLFNLAGGFIVGQFNFKGPVKSLTFSSDSRLLGVAKDSGFWVYQCSSVYRSFQPLLLIKKYKSRHSGKILGLQFSRDSRFVVTRGEDNIIFINNLYPIPNYLTVSLQAHRATIVNTFFSHDMAYLYSVDAANNLFVWKLVQQTTEAYNNLKQSKKRVRNNRKGIVQSQQQEEEQENLSKLQKQLSSGRYVLSKKLSLGQGSWLKRIVYKHQMGFLAGAYSNGRFAIWKLIDQQLQQVQSFSVGQHKISTLSVNDSCTWLALGIKSLGQLIVWQWKSQSYIINQRGFIHETRQLAYNGVSLYSTGNNEGTVKLWDSNSHFSIATFQVHTSAISGLVFSNPTTLFSSSLDGTVNAYDVSKQKKFRTFSPDARCQLVCLEVDPNGQVVFAGAFDPYDVYAWNVQTGHLLQVITGHQGPIACLAFTHQNLITGSWDNTVRMHSIFSRKVNVQTLQHGSQITAIATHPVRPQIAVATMKGQIFLWNCESGDMQGVLQSQMAGGRSYFSKISAENDPSTKFIKALAYSLCGNYLYGGGKSKFLHIYDISHRMLLGKIALTNNKDILGVVQQLNSKYIKNGVATYQLELQAQNQVYSDQENGEKLPGSKKIDISQIRSHLQVDVHKIIVKSTKELAVSTSFGTLLLTTVPNTTVFNPYQLQPNLTPALIPELIANQDYSSALLVTLKLNLNLKKLLKKIPIEFVKVVASELEATFAQIFIKKLCEQSKLNMRELIWVQNLVRAGHKVPSALRGSLQCLQDQLQLLMETRGQLQMVQQLV